MAAPWEEAVGSLWPEFTLSQILQGVLHAMESQTLEGASPAGPEAELLENLAGLMCEWEGGTFDCERWPERRGVLLECAQRLNCLEHCPDVDVRRYAVWESVVEHE